MLIIVVLMVKVKCRHCGHVWECHSQLIFITCASCLKKQIKKDIIVDDDNQTEKNRERDSNTKK
jgi:predicted  nucleic acid-binding Zn-ribbon protein